MVVLNTIFYFDKLKNFTQQILGKSKMLGQELQRVEPNMLLRLNKLSLHTIEGIKVPLSIVCQVPRQLHCDPAIHRPQ